jgi:hypothetical protein
MAALTSTLKFVGPHCHPSTSSTLVCSSLLVNSYPHLTCIGHSMTIVGFEKKTDGSKNLIVFDPMFHDATNIVKLIGRSFVHRDPDDLLKAYRRSIKYLKKYNEFELLK